MPYNILVCYGTRPEWIKVKPVINAMKRDNRFNPTVLFTGQHEDIHGGSYDLMINGIIPDTGNRLNDIIIEQLSDSAIDWNEYDAVLVQGDTASVFAMGLQAFNHQVPLIHLEAGMRTHDLGDPYPEEAYRQMISRIASLHLCPTRVEQDNLLLEEIDVSLTYIVGNTVLDNISHLYPTTGNSVYITMHRRENKEYIAEYFEEIVKLAEAHQEYEFIFPMHPSPMVQQHRHIFDGSRVDVVDPIDHNEFSVKLSNCAAVITDSGGVQEEAVFFNKPTVVCRRQMERHLCEGSVSFQAPDPETLSDVFEYAIKNFDDDYPCPYGDGNSSQRVNERIIHYIENLQ